MKGTVCIVDDHDGTRASISTMLESYGLKVHAHTSPEEILKERPTSLNIDVILFNLGREEETGIEVMKRLYNGHNHPAVVVLSNNPINSSALWSFLGGVKILYMPVPGYTIIQTIGKILGV